MSTTQAVTALRISSIPRARWGMTMMMVVEVYADRLFTRSQPGECTPSTVSVNISQPEVRGHVYVRRV